MDTIIRTSRLSLSFSNNFKKEYIKKFILDYKSLLNDYIDLLWGTEHQKDKFISYEMQKSVKTDLPGRVQQLAGLRALKIIKSQLNNPKKEKIRPIYEANVVELDSRFIEFLKIDSPLFDEIFRFRSGDRSTICCPIKYHKHYNKFKDWKRKKSVRIRLFHNKIFLDIFFEKEFEPVKIDKTIGVDVGIKKLLVDSDGNQYGKKIESLIEKINCKLQKSKAYYRAIKEKNYYIHEIIKQLPIVNYVVENLKNLKKDIKRKSRKIFRNKLQYWSYREILKRIQLWAEVVGVQCLLISPFYTSQTCSNCGEIHKISRQGEIFLCVNCGHTEDADKNASKNILNRGLSRENMVPERIKASTNR